MKLQVLVIHGGTTFNSYKEYIDSLKDKKITIDDLRPYYDWKTNLQNDLGENYDVLMPKMPDKQNAKYEEWKILFDKVIPLLNTGVIMIGHSLGGIFLAKYLSENKVPIKIRAIFLISAPFDNSDNESLADFIPEGNFDILVRQIEKIYLIQSRDDPYVSYENAEKYKRVIPKAEILAFNDRGHFRQESFPEIVKLIKSL